MKYFKFINFKNIFIYKINIAKYKNFILKLNKWKIQTQNIFKVINVFDARWFQRNLLN